MKKFWILFLLLTISTPAFASSNRALASVKMSDPAANGTATLHVKCEYPACAQNDDLLVTVNLNNTVGTMNNTIQQSCMDYINGLNNEGDPTCGGANTISSRDNVRLRGGFVS